MIYLTFDSNIWIYLLGNAWKKSNPLDYLEHWIYEEHVKILLPEIIYTEWGNHREKQKEEYGKKLHEFFHMAGDIFDEGVLKDYNQPEKLNDIIEIQFKRIEDIINKSQSINVNDEIKHRLIDWGINRKAPMHKKSSVADAMIIISLFEYIEQNPDNDYFFVTANKADFYSGKNIHPDLEEDFKRLKITSCKSLDGLIGQLSKKLPVTEDLNAKRKKRFHSKNVYAPHAIAGFEDFGNIYMEDIKQIDSILEKVKPTKNQLLIIFGLIQDPKLEEYFFQKIKSPIWFPILKERGYFSSDNNPESIKTDDGQNFPLWNILIYLEKLSLSIKEGSNIDLTDEILNIIKETTAKPVDNYRTWFLFIRIVNNLPNNSVPLEILELFGKWFNSEFGTSLQTDEVCGKTIPKFINENSNAKDIEKGDVLLTFLFTVQKKQLSEAELWSNDQPIYFSKVDYYHFRENLKSSIKRIANFYPDKIILLAESLRKLLFDFPRGINGVIENDTAKLQIKITLDNLDMIIQFVLNDDISTLKTQRIKDFLNIKEAQIKSQIVSFILDLGFNYEANETNEQVFENLLYFIQTDLGYTHYSGFIEDIGEERNVTLEAVMMGLLKNLLLELSTTNKESCEQILRVFLFENRFSMPFFKKMGLYIIKENWLDYNPVFWNLIQDKDARGYFSMHKFETDLFNLLEKNQSLLTTEQIETLDEIISKGPQNADEENIDYWRFRWYSALSDLELFKGSYTKLQEKINKPKEHFRDQGKMKVTLRSGSESPLELDDVLKMTNREIIDFIADFIPNDWMGPNIEGLATIIGKAVQTEPSKFTNELELFVDLIYIYEYRIIHGFIDAWKNDLEFDWETVLTYCNRCVISDKFTNGELKNEKDGWRADSSWVKGAVAELISIGLKTDVHSMPKSVVPMARSILVNLIETSTISDRSKSIDSDYVNFSINTTSGKVFQGYLDYLLWIGRNNFKETDIVKWNNKDRELFESILKKGFLEAYTFVGYYFSQFYFLDKSWLISKVKEFYSIEKSNWSGFFTGFSYGNPPANEEYYQLFYPHYKRAIENVLFVSSFGEHGAIRHLTAFHLFGFENLEEKSLLAQFIALGNGKLVDELVHFMSRQQDYLETLNKTKKAEIREAIFHLWEYIVKEYKDTDDDDKLNVLGSLTDWIVFAPELDQRIFDLVSIGIQYANRRDISYYLLNELNRLKDIGNKADTAKFTGDILISVKSEYYTMYEEKNMISLVEYLFQNDQYDSAVTICDNLAKQNIMYLNPIYEKYKR